jgi:ABC-type branched-subunit amino acid transport system ATPase component
VSIVLIEHIMKAVMTVSDAIAVLQDGELIVQGAPRDVANDKRVIAAYLGEGYVAG